MRYDSGTRRDGLVAITRRLIAHGASLNLRDKKLHLRLLIWAAKGSRYTVSEDVHHAALGRQLLDAGSPADWQSERQSQAVPDILAAWQHETIAGVPGATT